MANNDPELPPLGDDESGVMGLTQVEPSPVEETPIEFKEGYFPPEQASRATTLGLGNHGPAYYLTRIQKYSSYAFTVFASFHITNTSLVPLLTRSVPESNRYLLLTRPYYQSSLAEPILVALPLAAHITSGIALRFYRRHLSLKRYGAETQTDRKTIPWPALSGTSALGYALVPLAGWHVWTTRILPTYLHGDNSMISLSYISHGFALHPIVSFGGFIALVSAGTFHFVWGWAKWLGFSPAQASPTESRRHLTKKRRWYTINGISIALTGLWLAGSLGIVGRGGETGGWIGREFEELYSAMPLIRW
ncbi:uncharacterized protein N0V89_008388 [Didymosphaeria variabile]|uniref:Mitochondrial adapter protein MCP1 transmembrane domain-containing protein n=1 Tax=Didymosphaeria variabile TaxID=1932322 RepID=A0A9W8XFV3_9PLEO|nr:uncharacterized protein N0V89_008388 [Didymosphaeria variabile]KAJ4349770.1 hypothetical protein N0V89_008388 [Didymosphaeria variabile]